MRTTYIKPGDRIDTLEGFLIVDGFNGHIVYCREYTTPTEDFTMITDRPLTLRELGQAMKDVDGLNHNVRWEAEND